MTRLIPLLALTALLLLAPPSWAGDKEAAALLEKANAQWSNDDPQVPIKLYEQALAAEPTSKQLWAQIVFFKAGLHHVKTGEIEVARKLYDKLIRAIRTSGKDKQDPVLQQIKAQAFVRKGNIAYSEDYDPGQAYQFYMAAHKTWRQASTSEVASQLCYRLSRRPKIEKAKVDELTDTALELAREAVRDVDQEFPADAVEAREQSRARFMIQLAICLDNAGKAEEAKETWESIETKYLTPGSMYQQATWWARQGNEDKVYEILSELIANKQLYATPKARNTLRRFIREDEDFKPWLKANDGWQKLAKDEKPASQPASQ